jgi:membrane-associated phospholipid phosphatase
MGRSLHVGAALAAAALVDTVRRVKTGEVRPAEEQVFRIFNDAPDEIEIPVWTVMQSGSLAGVFVVSGELLRRGRTQTAAVSMITGTAVWAGIKIVKPLVGRGRPAHHLEGVTVRGKPQTGLGFPSGHAAVSLTLALMATKPGPARTLALGVAGATGCARMYVGAHLPLDVAGGFLAGGLVSTAAGAVRKAILA